MERKKKRGNDLYAYLDSIKILENGTDEAITFAKKEYWKNYRAVWRKSQRKRTKQVTVSFDTLEFEIIIATARKHQLSKTKMIKQACLAYISKTYIVVDRIAISKIQQLLAMNYNILKMLFDEDMLPFEKGRLALKQIEELDTVVSKLLKQPMTLDQWIADAVKGNSTEKIRLITLIDRL